MVTFDNLLPVEGLLLFFGVEVVGFRRKTVETEALGQSA